MDIPLEITDACVIEDVCCIFLAMKIILTHSTNIELMNRYIKLTGLWFHYMMI